MVGSNFFFFAVKCPFATSNTNVGYVRQKAQLPPLLVIEGGS